MQVISKRTHLRALRRQLTAVKREIDKLDDTRVVLFARKNSITHEIAALENTAPEIVGEPRIGAEGSGNTPT